MPPLDFFEKRNLIGGIAVGLQAQNEERQRLDAERKKEQTSVFGPVQSLIIDDQGNDDDDGEIPQGPQRVGSPVERWKRLMAATGSGVTVTSGFRSVAEQQAIWDRTPIERRGKWVARPGSSFHNKLIGGMSGAQDLAFSSPTIRNRFRELAPKYGFYQPMSYEFWHWEPIETKGQRGR